MGLVCVSEAMRLDSLIASMLLKLVMNGKKHTLPFDPAALIRTLGIGHGAGEVLAKYDGAIVPASQDDEIAQSIIAAAGVSAVKEKPVMRVSTKTRRWNRVPFLGGEMATAEWMRLAELTRAGDAGAKDALEELSKAVEWRKMPAFLKVRGEFRRGTYECHPDTWSGLSEGEKGMFEKVDVDEACEGITLR